MSRLFGELFSNNGINSHFLSNYLDITYVLIICLLTLVSCAPMPPLSFSLILLDATPQLYFSQREQL